MTTENKAPVSDAEIPSDGPRITPADIEANIATEHFFTAMQGVVGAAGPDDAIGISTAQTLDLLTFCVLVLRNGFTVTGESACAAPENFDAEIGKRFARQAAVAKVWPLMGYELRSKIARGMQPTYFVGHPDGSYSVADPQP